MCCRKPAASQGLQPALAPLRTHGLKAERWIHLQAKVFTVVSGICNYAHRQESLQCIGRCTSHEALGRAHGMQGECFERQLHIHPGKAA